MPAHDKPRQKQSADEVLLLILRLTAEADGKPAAATMHADIRAILIATTNQIEETYPALDKEDQAIIILRILRAHIEARRMMQAQTNGNEPDVSPTNQEYNKVLGFYELMLRKARI